MEHEAFVTSTVVFVAELERSVRFYTEVFGCQTKLNDEGGALLLAPGGFQLYLIEKGDSAEHPSEEIGAQYLMWGTETADDLTYFEQTLTSLGRYTYTHSSGGVTFVEGHRPRRHPCCHLAPEPASTPSLRSRQPHLQLTAVSAIDRRHPHPDAGPTCCIRRIRAATTDGVVRPPSTFAMISARSMPTALAIALLLS